MKTVLFVSLIFLMGISQCHKNTGKTENSILGQYDLAGYDNSGLLVFTGTISLVSLEQNHLKGQCKIVRRQEAPAGLLDQDANCEALTNGKKLSMDFAPSLDDAGLLLEGEFDGGLINGYWMLDGFVTSEPLGRFVAVR
jgi:hypothetical protein